MHRFRLMLLLLFVVTLGFTQDTISHRYSVHAGFHRGFLIAHRPMVIPLQKNKVNALELSFTGQTTGNRLWHHIYGFPEMGVSLALWDLGNPEKLGRSVTLMPFLNFTLAKSRWIDLNLKFGWGLGYIENKFDVEYNYKNVAIGSHLNFALLLQPGFRIKFSDRVFMSGGIALTHYSNGSTATPNLGLNFISATAGLAWQFNKQAIAPHKLVPEFKKNKRITAFISASSKQIYPANGPNYLAASLSVSHTWQISHKSALGAGFDLFYDHSLHQKVIDKKKELNNSLELFSGGLHGGYELTISDFTMLIDMGVYLYSKLRDEAFYHRIGLRYQLNKRIFVCSNIKTNWAKADFIELGIGIRK